MNLSDEINPLLLELGLVSIYHRDRKAHWNRNGAGREDKGNLKPADSTLRSQDTWGTHAKRPEESKQANPPSRTRSWLYY